MDNGCQGLERVTITAESCGAEPVSSFLGYDDSVCTAREIITRTTQNACGTAAGHLADWSLDGLWGTWADMSNLTAVPTRKVNRLPSPLPAAKDKLDPNH